MKENITEINLRVKEARKNLKLNQENFAKRLEVSKGFVGNVEAGNQQPSASFLNKLIKNCGISIDWLLTGKGSMKIKGIIYLNPLTF